MYPNLRGARYKASPNERFAVGMMSVNVILDRVANPQKLLFRNMINIDDVSAIRRSRSDFIVLHKFVMALKIMPDRMDTIPVYYDSVVHFADHFRRVFGPPVFEDSQIVCFRITKPE